MSYFEREARAQRAAGVSIEDIAKILRAPEARIERALIGEHVVRVVYLIGGPVLADADIISLLQTLPEHTMIQLHRAVAGNLVLDILPPNDVDSEEWSDTMASDLSEVGYNAVRAPRWHSGD